MYSTSLSITAADDGRLLGHAGLETVNAPAHIAEGSLYLNPDEVGFGFGLGAVARLTTFGFEQLNLNKIEFQVFDFNAPAIACYERTGFVLEGIRRDSVYRNGRFSGTRLYGLTQAEWRKLPSSIGIE